MKPGHREIFPQSAFKTGEIAPVINSLLRVRDPSCTVIQFQGSIILLKPEYCVRFQCFFVGNLCFQENQFLRITHQGEILRSMRLTVKVVTKLKIIQFAKSLKYFKEKCPGNELACQSILWPHQLKVLPSFRCCFALVLFSRVKTHNTHKAANTNVILE